MADMADMDDLSILTTTKKLLGIDETYTQFDTDIIIHINSTFMILNQLGVGPKNGFTISDSSAVWSDFTNNDALIEGVKSYVFMKVRMMFDPPSGATKEAMESMIAELESRLNYAVDPPDTFVESDS